MADSIELMSAGDHGNVATIYAPQCVTPSFAGWSGGRVLPEYQRKGDAIDVSEYTTLRLALQVHSAKNDGHLRDGLWVTIEHLLDGQWKKLHAFKRIDTLGHWREEVVLTGFGRRVRASWYFVSPNGPSLTVANGVSFNWSLTGEALPGSA